MSGAALIVNLSYGWLLIGAAVALVFLIWGVDRIVEDARDVYLFRVLATPGVILIWPLVLWRWRQKEQNNIAWQDHHSPSRKLAGWLEITMATALLALLLLAILIGPSADDIPSPVKLGANAEFGMLPS